MLCFFFQAEDGIRDVAVTGVQTCALPIHKRAIILGENSYGKGSVQSIIPLKNKGAIRLTVAKYYLPSGKSISEVGVRPDIEVNEEGEDFRIKTDTDNQLNYAIKLLNG